MRFVSVVSSVLTLAFVTGLSAQSGELERIVPKSVRTIAPVYPYEMLIEGREGRAEVEFTVEYSGRAVLASVANATDPAFAKALIADIEANEFIPPRINGQPRISPAIVRYVFNSTAGLDERARQILAELRKPRPNLASENQLDRKLTPLRQDVRYPYSILTDGVSGEATLEIVVDRTGRVLFPRIVSATTDDIGYAAATAVARWRYPAPVKGGQPVDARIQVKVAYDASKIATSW